MWHSWDYNSSVTCNYGNMVNQTTPTYNHKIIGSNKKMDYSKRGQEMITSYYENFKIHFKLSQCVTAA